MKKNTNKTSARVKINTVLLAVLAVMFGLATFFGANSIHAYRKNLIGVSDAPALCYNDQRFDDFTVIEDAYPCATDGEAITTTDEYAIFLYNRSNFAATINSAEIEVVLVTLGTMMTAAALFGAVLYWNHNRA